MNSRMVRMKVFWLVILFSSFGFSKEAYIFDVRKSLPLKPKEPVYHDYYINAGTESGLQKGMIVSVTRRVPVHDTYTQETQDDLIVTVAKIKLLFVQKKMSVGRKVQLADFKDTPVVEFQGLMVGDRIDIKSAAMADDTGTAQGAPTSQPASANSAPVEETAGAALAGAVNPKVEPILLKAGSLDEEDTRSKNGKMPVLTH